MAQIPKARWGTPPGLRRRDFLFGLSAADDFGHIVHDDPWAVLLPGDIGDIVVMLRFCNERRILAAPRGQGHATYGQAQVGGGQRVVCSPTRAPEFFHAVLAGLGQCAVLVRATLRLVPAPGHVRHYILYYPSVDALTADQRLVLADGRFSFVEGEAQLNPDGPGWQYYLEAAAYYDSTPPDDEALLGDLHFQRGTEQIGDLGYYDFLDRLAAAVAFLESTGE